MVGMIHSLGALSDITLIWQADCNNIIVKFGDKFCTAIYNVFTNLYYVDDVYGVLTSEDVYRITGKVF